MEGGRVGRSGGSPLRKWCSPLLGAVAGISISDDALCPIAECELGVSKERLVGGGNESACHLQDGVGGSGLDARGQLLSYRFLFVGQRVRHAEHLPVYIPNDAQRFSELIPLPSNFHDAYPG